MSTTKEQVLSFISKCEELKKCKFIMATTRIKELLKFIVNSPDLYRLFDTVTKDFDYISEKQNCLVTINDGIMIRSYIVLPQTVGRRLAFIFCLLVEFDRETLNFNDFLRKYFCEDGSYFASYQAFCSVIIDGLCELLRQVFAEQLVEEPQSQEEATVSNARIAKLISEISLLIAEEKQYVLLSAIPKEEKEGGYRILTELENAVKNGDENLIDALICGYNYYILYHRCVSDGVATLIETIAEFEQII